MAKPNTTTSLPGLRPLRNRRRGRSPLQLPSQPAFATTPAVPRNRRNEPLRHAAHVFTVYQTYPRIESTGHRAAFRLKPPKGAPPPRRRGAMPRSAPRPIAPFAPIAHGQPYPLRRPGRNPASYHRAEQRFRTSRRSREESRETNRDDAPSVSVFGAARAFKPSFGSATLFGLEACGIRRRSNGVFPARSKTDTWPTARTRRTRYP